MEVKTWSVNGTNIWRDGKTFGEQDGTVKIVDVVLHSDHLATTSSMQATIAELTRERDALRGASRWIPVDMAKMEAGTVCDLWEPFHGRLSNYRLVKNYAGKSGNHFFEPVSSGLSCVRTATHYIGIPKGPTL